jgi:hypothetical protein
MFQRQQNNKIEPMNRAGPTTGSMETIVAGMRHKETKPYEESTYARLFLQTTADRDRPTRNVVFSITMYGTVIEDKNRNERNINSNSPARMLRSKTNTIQAEARKQVRQVKYRSNP